MADLNELELPSLSGVLPPDPDTAKWEMLIDQIISEKKQSYNEKQSRSKIEQAFFLKCRFVNDM